MYVMCVCTVSCTLLVMNCALRILYNVFYAMSCVLRVACCLCVCCVTCAA